jgi:hypothetical protein
MRARLIGLLLLLPVLLCGQALGGAVLWLHAHGTAGGHVHVLAAAHDGAGHDAHDAWHAEQHRHEHSGAGHRHEREDEDRGPRGVRIEFPQVLETTRPDSTLSSARALSPLALQPAALAASYVGPDRGRSPAPPQGPPPRRQERSAVAELLRSSHALLI